MAKSISKTRIAFLLVFAFGFLIYANTLNHEYALDDKMVIWKNQFTQKGIEGIPDILSTDMMAGMFGDDSEIVQGGRYRPLSMVTFAIEQEITGGNPHFSHFINVVLYALILVLLLKLSLKLWPEQNAKNIYLSLAFWLVLLFAAHPLHTEVVANIKGRDELLVFLGAIAALWYAIRYAEKKNPGSLFLLFTVFFLGLMSKEVLITFLFVIPFSMWFFRLARKKENLHVFLTILAASLLYIGLRWSVLGQLMGAPSSQLMNNPFLEAQGGEKYATVAFCLLYYLKLLLIPHPLTWDYYPYHIELMQWNNWQVLVSVLVYGVLLVLAVKGLKRRKWYAWAIWYYFATISLTSNIVINIGAFMSERFLFFPSLAFCFVLAYFLKSVLPKLFGKELQGRQIAVAFLVLILALYSVKTVSRNRVWKDSYTLFGHDVEISENSAKGNSSWGSELYDQAQKKKDSAKRNAILRKARPYMKKAVRIHPAFVEPRVRLANIAYLMNGDYKTMMAQYDTILSVDPNNQDVWGNALGVLTKNVDDPPFEAAIWKKFLQRNPQRVEPYMQLGNLYISSLQKPDSAVYYYKRAIRLKPGVQVYMQLGVAYGKSGKPLEARKALEKALELQPGNVEILRLLGISYGVEGKHRQAAAYFKRALERAPENARLKQEYQFAMQKAAAQGD